MCPKILSEILVLCVMRVSAPQASFVLNPKTRCRSLTIPLSMGSQSPHTAHPTLHLVPLPPALVGHLTNRSRDFPRSPLKTPPLVAGVESLSVCS